jgi:2-methylisocitrate lyase-like PEP mutase family enzyme
MPDATEFEHMGVARITIASAPTLMTMDAIRKLAADFRSTGSFGPLKGSFHHPDAQKLFNRKDDHHESTA